MNKLNFYDKLNFDRFKIIRPYIVNKKVLDIGALGHNVSRHKEPGWLHGLIKKKAKRVTGIDIQKNGIEALKKKGYDLKFGNAEDFSLNEKFDVIIAAEVIEHLTNFSGFFKSVSKHLKKNGKLIITTPNSFGLYYFMGTLLKRKYSGNPEHICWFDLFVLRQLVKRFGFRVKRHYYLEMLYPTSRKALFSKAPLFKNFWIFLSRFIPRNLKNTLIVVVEKEKI